MNKENKLDIWSQKLFEESFLGKLICRILPKFPVPGSISNILFYLLLLSLSILLGSLYFPQFSSDRFGIGFIILFCFLCFLANLLFNKDFRSIKFNLTDLVILLFIFILCISTFSSYFFKESLIGLVKYILFFLAYFMFKTTINNSGDSIFKYLWIFLISCATVVSIIGIYQYIAGVEPLATWEDPSIENIHTRVYSTLGNPNLLGGFLLLILPVSLGFLLDTKLKILYKMLFLLCGFSILVCLIFTGSRGAYLGLVSLFLFGSFISVYHLNCRKNIFKSFKNPLYICFLLAALISLLYLVLTFVFPIFTERLSTIFTLREHSSNSYRLNVWFSCLRMFKENWLIGVGPGNNTFRLAYGLYMISGFDALGAYNIFLEFAVESGILGPLIFGLLLLISFLKLHYIFWTKNNYMALCIFLSLISIITHGMVDTVFFRPQIFIPFWLLLASIDKLENR